MTTLVNFRVDVALHTRAAARAKTIGLPLSAVFRNLLAGFVESDEPVLFGRVEKIKLPPRLETRAQRLDKIAEKAVAKKLAAKMH